MIPVTKPFLPPYEDYEKLLKEVWQRNWLTNNGPCVKELELKLADYLQIDHIQFVTNGTIAIQLAIQALELTGEIITTPFSYVATTSSIVWEKCKPVFTDINNYDFNIDPTKIEVAVTEKTQAILATHVYGNACEVEAIQKIAEKHNLKVIYDAAHCFGTTYKGKSVLEFGDISTVSFHATKLFHTVEGGGIVTNNLALDQKISFMKNFGHNGPEIFESLGINGKNSEFHAAMGLVNLKYINKVLEKRKSDYLLYNELLKELNIVTPAPIAGCKPNYSYFPAVFDSENTCIKVLNALQINSIQARRYFYPLLSDLPYTSEKGFEIARDISKRVLCLPLYEQLESEEIKTITEVIIQTVKS